MEATAQMAPQVREQSGAVAALDSMATPSNWIHSPPADLETADRKPHMLFNTIQPLKRQDRESRVDFGTITQPFPQSNGLPVYVMLPLDSVWLTERDGVKVSVLKREKALKTGLRTLKQAGVEGVMVDVWWGVVEAAGPLQYDFSAYRQLFEEVVASGLKVQAVASFHAAGGNVGDTCNISLPKWVLEVGEEEPDIFHTDAMGTRNRECLSLGCDNLPLFQGRTPIQMYQHFIEAFVDNFSDMFGTSITEVTIGLGPAGELRYPAYPEGDGRWRFPGVGEFQCYDRFMLQDLKAHAIDANHPEWGLGGPHDAGSYNSLAWETGFFVSQGGSWDSEYGDFFLSWYSQCLLDHADRVLTAASQALAMKGMPRSFESQSRLEIGETVITYEPACVLGVKLAGVHWWFKSRSHAGELTAGYYNTRDRNGYEPVMRLLARHNARVSFTCVEMRDCEHPRYARCSPQGLLEQIIQACTEAGVPLAGENALQRYDQYAFDRIAESAFGRNARAGHLEQLTFLRMGDLMFENFAAFSQFLNRLRTKSYPLLAAEG